VRGGVPRRSTRRGRQRTDAAFIGSETPIARAGPHRRVDGW